MAFLSSGRKVLICGYGLGVEYDLAKIEARVRVPVPAQRQKHHRNMVFLLCGKASLRQKASLIVKIANIHNFFDKTVDNYVCKRDKRQLL